MAPVVSARVGVVRVKAGVKFDRIEPAGFRILAALDGAARLLGSDLTITCGTEDHGPTDPHTLGRAYDVSVKDFTVVVIVNLKSHLSQVLGARFTVLYETPTPPADPTLASLSYVNADASGPHFHLQPMKGTSYPPADHPELAPMSVA